MTFISRIRIYAFLLLASSATQADEVTELLQQGQMNLANGYYREAERQFSQAQKQATEQQNAYQQVSVQTMQGYMALRRQNNEQALQLLSSALEQSKKNNWFDLTARINLYLGQLYDRNQEKKQATQYFQNAVAQPEKILDKTLLVSGFYQLAKLAIDTKNPQQAWQSLQQATKLIESLPINPDHSQLWLNIGYQALHLHELSPKSQFANAAFEALNKALIQARQNQQARTQALALKQLALLYKQQHRISEAIDLFAAAIKIAQKEEAADVLIDLEWQIGQLYQHQNQADLAISNYRLAVKNIDKIRIDIPVSYQEGRSSFRDTFAPIYLALADLLLQQSATAAPTAQQALLLEAQDSIERMKKSEMEDYFQSRCDISATPINLKKTDSHAAAIYPIPLPDRLEIIVYTAEGLKRFISPVSATELEQQARHYAADLREDVPFAESKPHAQLLYRWIIAPVDAFLKQQHIDTLIYMPDGALRLLPLSALYDGKKFVIESYAVATSPGMTLINSEDFQHQNRIMLAGMSVPGDVVTDLPDVVLNDLFTEAPKGKSTERGSSTANKSLMSIEEKQKKSRELRSQLKKITVISKLQEALALPGVEFEIKQLAEQNHVDYLLNETFSLEHFTQALIEQPHDILHIASHGFFGSTSEDSFIMTHNKILNLNTLQMLLNSDYFKLYPVDLLTLSACQTAAGDDRSPLGISGVAIKAKVHSVLGSLWTVDDDATAKLMTNFYQLLKKPQQTKAKALQAAELMLLKDEEFAEPSLWSPFILVGNWL